MALKTIDVVVLALACFIANVGVAITGLGMAIIYIFVWQIAVLCGYSPDIKFALFVQAALGLLSARPSLVQRRKSLSMRHPDF